LESLPYSPDLNRLQGIRPAIEKRAAILRAVRDFFHRHGFLEVDTPVRIRAPAPEEYIDAEPSGARFLRTSPELHMKRMLAAGYEKIFQIGPCFRAGERGDRHRPEFAMLEWYRAHADYSDILLDTKAMIVSAARAVLNTTSLTYQGRAIELVPVWEHLTVQEAFLRWARWDPLKKFDPDRFDEDLVTKVEPSLPRDVPTVLTDYPVERAALSRPSAKDPRVAERWELYIGGLELANAYSELTDATEQKKRFAHSRMLRELENKPAYPEDDDFMKALEIGIPPSGGIALGLDRLIMLLTDSATIDDVTAFEE